MHNSSLLITVLTHDRPGIIQILSNVILSHKGAWQESSFSKLCNQFAGIVRIEIAESHRQALIKDLESLHEQGINIHFPSTIEHPQDIHDRKRTNINVEANDREGIIDEITTALSESQINIVKMDTSCESASMAGYNIFKANLRVSLPETITINSLKKILESVSDDLMVSID